MKTPHRYVAGCLLLILLWSASAGAAPSHAGKDARKLQEIPQRVQQFVDDGTISGAVTLVARSGEVVSLGATGLAEVAGKKPMRPDNLFWIASMTKPITASAVLMLQDEGKLSVDDPVEKHLPEFKNQWLIESRSDDKLF